jgi:DNA helicase-2/ATP-dependent DNA helicase PcrA
VHSSSAALNPEQHAAVTHLDGPLMVLAGAGTGKTRVLVHRIAHLVESGVHPRTILAVTFTNKAAKEMRDRLGRLLGPTAQGMAIGTFHATCARLLRHWAHRVGLTKTFQIFDDDDQIKAIERLLKEHHFDEAVTARSILSRIDRAKNQGLDPTTIRTGLFTDEIIDVVYPRYQAQLAKENAVDFNDLLLKTLALFADEEAGPRLTTRFAHVLVDEFQDTNLVQYDLVRKLAAATRNLTVVGDDDQSIYAWRGAEPRNLLDFDRDFPDATVVKLEQNYRSTQVILDAANAVISKNRDRHGKALWTEQAGGDPIETFEAGDDRSEAMFIAAGIRRLLDDGPHGPQDIAVLYRTNAQSRLLEERLRAVGIIPKVLGAVSFFERREIKDAIAYLRLLANPAADSAFERIINVPARGLGDTTVERLRAAARASGGSLLHATRLAARGEVSGLAAGPRRKLAGFVELIDGLHAVIAAGASVAELIIQVVERSGMRGKLEADDSTEARDRLANLAELVTTASDFDDDHATPAVGADLAGEGEAEDLASAPTVEGFLERIALSSAIDQGETDQAQVTLMTIHIAKGLEYPVVFICGLEDGLFPSLRERDGVSEDAALEEERRLAYVAITRAREQLVMTHARTRRVWGELRLQVPSRVLEDIPLACLAAPRRRVIAPAAGPAIVDGGWATAGGQGGAWRGPPGGGRAPSGRAPSGRPPGPGRGASHDEFDQRAPDDDVPVYRQDGQAYGGAARYGVGARVSHAAFGDGRVVEAQGEGKDLKIVVDFASVGRKTVYARYLEA